MSAVVVCTVTVPNTVCPADAFAMVSCLIRTQPARVRRPLSVHVIYRCAGAHAGPHCNGHIV